MGLARPQVGARKFSEIIGEDTPFILDGARTVEVDTDGYGKGTMALLTVRGQEGELGIWGSYLLAQVEQASSGDFGKHYRVTRRVVPEFSKREVKALTLYDPETDSDIPF